MDIKEQLTEIAVDYSKGGFETAVKVIGQWLEGEGAFGEDRIPRWKFELFSSMAEDVFISTMREKTLEMLEEKLK